MGGWKSKFAVAVESGDLPAARDEVKKDASIVNTALDSTGFHALHYASAKGHAEMVRMLLEAKNKGLYPFNLHK